MFAVRQLANNARCLVPGLRQMSASAGPLVDVAIDGEGIATVTLQRPPVNSLNLELLQAMSKAFGEVERNKAKAVILTSAMPTTFSAGLDIMEMYKPDMKRCEEFWSSLQDCWLKYYGLPLITAAAINGHAPAGGCLFSLSSEYRVMVGGKFAIGLNETALGIVAPSWFQDCLFRTINPRQAELALTLGRMFSTDEAHKVGIVDEIATDKADAIEKCKNFIKKFDRIPAQARAYTKMKVRQGPMENLLKNRQADLQEFLTFVKDPKVQKSLEFYINSLKKKSAK